MSTVRERAPDWEDDDLRYEPPPGATSSVSDRGAWVRQSSAVVQATSAATPAAHSAMQPVGAPADDGASAEAEDEWEDVEDWEDEQDGEEWEDEREARPTRRRRRGRSRGATDTALIRRSWISFVMVSLVRGALLVLLFALLPERGLVRG